MKIPKFAQELMVRSAFELGDHKKDYDPGYTIRIRKATPYTKIETLEAECERLVKWAQRNGATDSRIDSDLSSVATHYRWQYAIVTIYDPCMKYLEAFMPRKEFEQ